MPQGRIEQGAAYPPGRAGPAAAPAASPAWAALSPSAHCRRLPPRTSRAAWWQTASQLRRGRPSLRAVERLASRGRNRGPVEGRGRIRRPPGESDRLQGAVQQHPPHGRGPVAREHGLVHGHHALHEGGVAADLLEELGLADGGRGRRRPRPSRGAGPPRRTGPRGTDPATGGRWASPSTRRGMPAQERISSPALHLHEAVARCSTSAMGHRPRLLADARRSRGRGR